VVGYRAMTLVSRAAWPTRRSILLGLAGLLATKARAEPVPRKVACLDWALAETMLALGAEPMAVVAAADWPRFVVEPELPSEIADLGLQQELNFELLAMLRPDLILISPFLGHLKPQLARIAPFVELSVFEDDGAPLAQRELVTRELSDRLGLRPAAEAYLAAANAEFDQLAERASRLPPRPVLLTTFVDARHVRVYGGSSLFQNTLTRLGIENAWPHPVGYFGYDLVGIERLATGADLQLIAFDPVPPDLMPKLSDSPLWTRLPFIEAGRFATLPPVLMFGGMPSALRFARLLVTELESAAQ